MSCIKADNYLLEELKGMQLECVFIIYEQNISVEMLICISENVRRNLQWNGIVLVFIKE